MRDVTLAACIVIWLATPLLLAVLCGGPLNLRVRDEIPRGKARQSIGRRVDGFLAPQADHFGDHLARSRCEHHTMAAEPCGHKEAGDLRMRPQDGILVRCYIIVACPSALQLHVAIDWETLPERRQDMCLKLG